MEHDVDSPLQRDLRAQAELLAYLVISQLITRQTTGDWMSIELTVESTRAWLHSSRRNEEAIRRVMIASRALDLAQGIRSELGLVLNGSTVASMFDENCRLDFNSTVAHDIYLRCRDFLVGMRWQV
jgi:hypothetical protein